MLAGLARQQDIDRDQLLPLWKRGIMSFADDSQQIVLTQQYLTLMPDDKDVSDKLAVLRRHADMARRAAIERNDPMVQLRESALVDLDKGDTDTAQAKLMQALAKRPQDPVILGALGRIKLRQGQHAEAEKLFTQARDHDPENRKEWQGLVTTTRFWGLMKQARQARDNNDLTLAGLDLKSALALNPRQPDALAMQADLAEQRGDSVAAEAQYRQILQRNPDSTAALTGLTNLLLVQKRDGEATRLLDRLATLPAAHNSVSETRAGMLRHQADDLIALGQNGDAVALLNSALALTPEDPWLRYSLAKLYLKQGDGIKAEATMVPVLTPPIAGVLAPGNRYAYALFESAHDNDAQALTVMNDIPTATRSESMQRFVQRLQMDQWLADAANVTPGSASNPALARAQALAGDDAEMNYRIAVIEADLGAPERGLSRMQDGDERARAAAAAQPASSEVAAAARFSWALNKARYLDHVASEPALDTQLAELDALAPDLTDAQNSDVSSLHQRVLERRIDTLRRTGDLSQARQQAALAVRRYPDSVALQLTQAQVELDDHETGKAILLYRRILNKSPQTTDAEFGIADAQILAGDKVAARATLLQLERRISPDQGSDRFALARRYVRIGDTEHAHQLVYEQLTLHPDRADTLVQVGNYEESQANYRAAESRFTQAAVREGKPLEPDLVSVEPRVGASAAERGLSRLAQRQDGYITTGATVLDKSGSDGLSTNKVLVVPTEFYLPIGYDGHFIGHIDQVNFNAGTLPADPSQQLQFGKIQALAPTGVPSMAERASGTAVGVGYETDNYRADIGTTPLGFPVGTIVGGLKFYRSSDNTYSTLDISRRPVTSSLLSYAGVYDPVTRQVWGGVVRTGVSYRFSVSEGRMTRSISATANVLTGQNVQSNNELRLVLGQNHDVLVRPNDEVNVGVNLTYWAFQHDLSNFTYGQGGYYSPQTSLGISLPLRWVGRYGKWAYRLSPAIGLSWARSGTSPYYPTDANLQALATNPLYSAPVYGSSHGQSFNYSVQGALEYRVLPNWFVGASYQMDHSPYYTPNVAQLYLRYELKPKSGAVVFPPRPVRAYADF